MAPFFRFNSKRTATDQHPTRPKPLPAKPSSTREYFPDTQFPDMESAMLPRGGYFQTTDHLNDTVSGDDHDHPNQLHESRNEVDHIRQKQDKIETPGERHHHLLQGENGLKNIDETNLDAGGMVSSKNKNAFHRQLDETITRATMDLLDRMTTSGSVVMSVIKSYAWTLPTMSIFNGEIHGIGPPTFIATSEVPCTQTQNVIESSKSTFIEFTHPFWCYCSVAIITFGLYLVIEALRGVIINRIRIRQRSWLYSPYRHLAGVLGVIVGLTLRYLDCVIGGKCIGSVRLSTTFTVTVWLCAGFVCGKIAWDVWTWSHFKELMYEWEDVSDNEWEAESEMEMVTHEKEFYEV